MIRGEVNGTHQSSEPSIGAGAFDYDFGALENSDNKFTKSYTNLMYDSLSSTARQM